VTKGEAVAKVADRLAGELLSGSFEEMTGFCEDDVSQADYDRLVEAVDEVANRLYRMGRARR
jgi:hypothetical protein